MTDFIINSGAWDSSSITMSGITAISYVTDSGHSIGAKLTTDRRTKRIGFSLYFKYVKSKFTKVEQNRLKKRLLKLQHLVKSAKESDQQALYETLSEKLVFVVKQSESVALGYDKFVPLEVVNKFINIAKDSEQMGSIKFSKLSEFPRPIPSKVQAVIDKLNKKEVFEDLHVLYLTYDTNKLKTNKEKIREKDPILFGSFKSDPSNLFYIVDWVDEYCDLTLDKFIDAVKDKELGLIVDHVPDLDDKFVNNLVKEVKERRERLESTKQSNYVSNMMDEDRKKYEQGLSFTQRLVRKWFKLK